MSSAWTTRLAASCLWARWVLADSSCRWQCLLGRGDPPWAGGGCLQIFYDAFLKRFGRGSGAIWLLGIPLGACWFCGLLSMTAASRMMYSFSRDGALPFGRLIRHVDPGTQAPVIAGDVPLGSSMLLASTALTTGRHAADQQQSACGVGSSSQPHCSSTSNHQAAELQSFAVWAVTLAAILVSTGLLKSLTIFLAISSVATAGLAAAYCLPLWLRILVRQTGLEPGPFKLGRWLNHQVLQPLVDTK